MVKCFVPGCTSRHKFSKEHVYLFKPSVKEIVTKWSQIIPRVDRTFGENDYLCAKHFDKNDIIYTEMKDNVLHRRIEPKLVKDAIPKYFDEPAEVSNVKQQNTIIDSTLVKKTCVACNGSEILENGRKISYYLFPTNPELRKQWISAAQLQNTTLPQFAYLCSKHFEENCFDNVILGTLKENALPSRFGSSMINSNETESMVIDFIETNSEATSVPFCIVKSCKHEGNIRGITYHQIPKNNYAKWVDILKDCTKVYPIPFASKVCSMHFKAKDFLIQGNKIKLNSEALPKLHINEYLTNESSNISATNSLSNHETDERSIRKLKETILLSSVINPDPDIVKSDFALIDINSIIKKHVENEPNNLSTNNFTKTSYPTENLTIINAMHNYCNAQVADNVSENYEEPVMKVTKAERNNRVQMDTTKSVSERLQLINTSDENNDEEDKKKNIIRKLRAYKQAYKKHKSINRKQSDKILILEKKLEENARKNKKLEHRILILEDIIQNSLRKREEAITDLEEN